MFRVIPYIVLFLTAVLSQVFIFDNLSASVVVAPLVYVIFLILLPIECPQILMLGAGVALGVTLDASMGTEGLNSIATIAVAFFRAPIIRLLVGRERTAERGVPSEITFGNGDFMLYLVVVVLLHHFIFFFFESLTFSNLGYTAVRFAVSSAISFLYVWLMARVFINSKKLK